MGEELNANQGFGAQIFNLLNGARERTVFRDPAGQWLANEMSGPNENKRRRSLS
jgi:hypothetical protein